MITSFDLSPEILAINVLKALINTFSMKQPDLYILKPKNDVTSLVKFCIENTSRRRVFSVNFD